MSLPVILQAAIEEEIKPLPLSQLTSFSKELSLRYKEKKHLLADQHRLAYLAVRMPATFAAIKRVLSEIPAPIQSFLDLGAGPGTGMWAAREIFPELQKITLLEKDKSFITLGKRLAKGLEALWIEADLQQDLSLQSHDLILLSYVIGEISEKTCLRMLKNLLPFFNQYLVVIEPGTPEGFARIRTIREMLIKLNLFIIAPCSHQNTCPIAGTDWCHFAERLNRTSVHRKMKGAELGYEDEKFSYLIVSKSKPEKLQDRIIRHPLIRPGHVKLTLCTEQGLADKTFSRKHKEAYRKAFKSKWGDTL